jgi:ATP-dependent Clp protease ATP-binding subunit ClpC
LLDGYSEKARRAIFFARYEAGRFSSTMVESEHLLLGIMREDKALMRRLIISPDSIQSIQTQIEARTPVQHEISIVTPPEMLKDRDAGSPVSFEIVRKLIEANPSVHEQTAKSSGLLFSDECTRVIGNAEAEANPLNKRIGIEHLVLGILREHECFAARLLNERGVTLQLIHEAFK